MTATTERAILAGGCFWGMQQLVRRLPGVVSTRVGYSGGDVKNATYRNHGTHAEAIEITFDPSQTSFRDLLEFFFQIHDPTTPNRQGNDRGTSYRSAIFYTSEEQRRVAEDTIADVEASGLWPGKVVTEVAAIVCYLAETFPEAGLAPRDNERARARRVALVSTALTRPRRPTRAARSRTTTPVPQPTSSTRSPAPTGTQRRKRRRRRIWLGVRPRTSSAAAIVSAVGWASTARQGSG